LRTHEVLRTYIRAGSVAAAAYELGISETTVRHLSGPYRRTGCLNAAQAAYWLGAGEHELRERPLTVDGLHAKTRTTSVTRS
jgi:DNA-binding NarL/FixJ family response regulator